jgi:hypothetical protein
MNIVTPKEIGFSAARLDRMNSVMQGYVEQDIFKGMINLRARR